MKTLRSSIQGASLVLCTFMFSLSAASQTCQLEHSLVLGNTCPDGHVLQLKNPFMECYDAVRLILENGTFSHWEPNTVQGWEVEEIGPNELLITNTNGFLPMEDQAALTFWNFRPGGLPDKVFLQYDDQCSMEGCEWTYDLPGCGESVIAGKVYLECGEEPYTDQPGFPEAVVQLEDAQGVLLQEITTDISGNYAFGDLPPAFYTVRLMQMQKDPKNPKDGFYEINLLPGQELNLNFGVCPILTCDDLEIVLQQEPVQNDTAFVRLLVGGPNHVPYVKFRGIAKIDSGAIVGVTPPPDWEVIFINSQHIELMPVSEDWWYQVPLPLISAQIAVDFGIKEKGIKMTLTIEGDGNSPPEPMCMDSIILEDPTKYVEYTCCPAGKTAGPEQVIDGHFVGPGLPASDYTSWVSGPINQGEIAIFDMNQAYAANNSWVCPGYINVWDTYLAVDGHGTPNQAAWSQQVTGLTPGGEYQFCALVANLVTSAKDFDDPAIVLEIIDDINPTNTWTSPPLTVPENPKLWVQHSLTWTAPTSTSYTLRIYSNSLDPVGNDFALDRVSFRECVPIPQDTCCKDLVAFCADLDSLIVFNPDSCKVTMDLGALPLCYTIEWVDWGQGPEYGPWTSSTFPMPMHAFSGNGTFPISYLAIAYNDTNAICLEKIMEDTLVLNCQICECSTTGMDLVHNGISYPLACTKGAPTSVIPCPAEDIIVSGFFGCETPSGDLCEETEVPYVLTGPNGLVDQGVTTPFTAFLWSGAQVAAPGTYTLHLTTLCPGQTDSCVCNARWIQPPCDTCFCNGFSDMYIRTYAGLMNQPVACGDDLLTLPCPEPGNAYQLTGVFDCVGDSCKSDRQIDWTLSGPGGSHNGSFTDNDAYFGISLLPSWFNLPGLYTLSLQGICDGDTCACELSFMIDCPDLCPCDVEQLSQNVNQGFAVAVANKSCNACFSPLALSDCETVEWWIDAVSGPPEGITTGANTFCHTFPGPGTYTVYMVVTRLKPDGSLCEAFTHAQTVQVSCVGVPPCTLSIFDNPGLNEGSVSGALGAGGECPGWFALADEPLVVEGAEGSADGWSVLLTGCYFNSDVLVTEEPVCMTPPGSASNPTARVMLRTPGEPIPGADVKVGRKPPGGSLMLGLLNPQAAQPPFGLYPPEGKYLIVLRNFLPLEDDWYELTVPFDLSNWDSQDSCGENHSGYPLHLAIGVSNLLSNDQGNGIVRDAILVDQICMDGELVSVDPTQSNGRYRVWPNPGRQSLQVELPAAALPGTRLRLVNLTGLTVASYEAAIGNNEQSMALLGLPPGMYFLVIERNGIAQAILRWVSLE